MGNKEKIGEEIEEEGKVGMEGMDTRGEEEDNIGIQMIRRIIRWRKVELRESIFWIFDYVWKIRYSFINYNIIDL